MKHFLFVPFVILLVFASGCSENPTDIGNSGTVVDTDTTDITIPSDTSVPPSVPPSIPPSGQVPPTNETEETNPPSLEPTDTSDVSNPDDNVGGSVPGVITDSVQTPPLDSVQESIVEGDTVQQNVNRGLTIYYIRHAETVANATGTRDPQSEGHNAFSELGYAQLDSLTTFLIENSIDPDVIIVSPAWRAQETIEPYLLATQKTAEIWVEMNECCGGEPANPPLPFTPTVSRLRAEIEAENTSFRNDEDIYFWFPQTYEEGLFMVMTAMDSLLTRYSQTGRTIIIIGHAAHGRIFTGLIRGYDMLTEIPETEIFLRNIGIHHFRQDPETGEIALVQQNINFPNERWW